MTQNVAQLRWRCRRGMRELDAVLQGFLERTFGALDDGAKAAFGRVLDLPDPDLYAYLTGRHVPEDPDIAGVIAAIRASAATAADH
jgi:antitoxin CptB